MRISDWSSDVCSSDLGQVLRLVLEHADLIVDLLQRPGSGQDILAIIGRIEHGPLCVYRLARHHHAHHQGAGSAEAERGRDQIFTRKHRSEEHTSTPVTNAQLVCRLLLEKKKYIE